MIRHAAPLSCFQLGTADFLCSSWYSSGFGILDFGFRRTWIKTHWCFRSCWAELTLIQETFSFLCSASEEEHRKLVGSTGGLIWTVPKGYSVPAHEPEETAGNAGHCLGTASVRGSEQLYCALPVFLGFCSFFSFYFYHFFFQLLKSFYLPMLVL